MADDQNLSTQDVKDLQDIASKLPTGHPMQEKIALLLSSQPTQFENQKNAEADAEGPLKRFARSALSSAGLPETINDIPAFGNKLIARDEEHPYGQWAPQYQGSDLQKAVSKPTTESVVNAVPIVGPTSVKAAQQIRSGDYAGAAGTVAGLPAAVRAGGEVQPGLRDLKTTTAEALRNPDNSLKTGTRLMGAGVGAGIGAAVSPNRYVGATVGGGIGGGLADFLAPNRAPAFKSPGYYSDFSDLAEGAFQPLSESPTPKPIMSKLPSRLPASLRGDPFAPPMVEATPVPPELGSPENPGPFSKLPNRLPPQYRGDPFSPPSGETVQSPTEWESSDEMLRRGASGVNPTFKSIRRNYNSDPQDLISRMKKIAVPGEEPTAADLKRAGDMTQTPIEKLRILAKFGDRLAQNEINRRLKQ